MYEGISETLDPPGKCAESILTGLFECDIPYASIKSKDRDYLFDPWQFKQGMVGELSENDYRDRLFSEKFRQKVK